MWRFFKKALEWAEHVKFFQEVGSWLVEHFGVPSVWERAVSGIVGLSSIAAGIVGGQDFFAVLILGLFGFASSMFGLHHLAAWRTVKHGHTTEQHSGPPTTAPKREWLFPNLVSADFRASFPL